MQAGSMKTLVSEVLRSQRANRRGEKLKAQIWFSFDMARCVASSVHFGKIEWDHNW